MFVVMSDVYPISVLHTFKLFSEKEEWKFTHLSLYNVNGITSIDGNVNLVIVASNFKSDVVVKSLKILVNNEKATVDLKRVPKTYSHFNKYLRTHLVEVGVHTVTLNNNDLYLNGLKAEYAGIKELNRYFIAIESEISNSQELVYVDDYSYKNRIYMPTVDVAKYLSVIFNKPSCYITVRDLGVSFACVVPPEEVINLYPAFKRLTPTTRNVDDTVFGFLFSVNPEKDIDKVLSIVNRNSRILGKNYTSDPPSIMLMDFKNYVEFLRAKKKDLQKQVGSLLKIGGYGPHYRYYKGDKSDIYRIYLPPEDHITLEVRGYGDYLVRIGNEYGYYMSKKIKGRYYITIRETDSVEEQIENNGYTDIQVYSSN